MLTWLKKKIKVFNPKFDKAVSKVLINEGGLSNDPADPGGLTQYGISLRFLKDVGIDINGDGVVDGKDIYTLTENDAKQIYHDYWWDKYAMGTIDHPEIAFKVLDFSINMGTKQAVKLLQRACNMCTPKDIIIVDGILGMQTFNKVNSLDTSMLLKNYKYVAGNFYRQLVMRNVELKKFEKGWLNRAEK